MRIDITHEGTVTVLRLSGALVIGEPESAVNKAVERLVSELRVHLFIDLRDVTAIDSSGIDTMVRAWHSTHEHSGSVKIVNASPKIRALFDLTRLSDIFEIENEAPNAASRLGADRRELRA